MSQSKPPLSLADYVTIAISPALIIGMVNSLMFFLILILGQGQADGLFNWIIFWFGVAIVLISRVAVEISSQRAIIYGAALSIAVWVTAGGPSMPDMGLTFMGVLAVVWWAAHKLTYDCTVLDESRDASGQGILDAAKLEGTSGEEESDHHVEAIQNGRKKKKRRRSGFAAWLKRYRDYRTKQLNKPHALGVWVIYFSLAALPLYGLGQSLLPPGDLERRRYAFWLMSTYVASGLGLLMTTSFLSLRRYLRQRRLRMPAAITSIWLTIGGALIVGLLIAGAILPRPNAEYAVSDLISWAKTDDREASEHSIIRKGDAKGDGAASKDKSENKPDAKPGDGTKKGDEGKTKENPDADTSRNKDGEKPKDSSQSNAGKQSDSGKKSSDNDSAKKSEPKGERSSNEKGSDSGESSQKPDWFKPMHSIMEGVGPILKFIVYGVAILAGIFILIRFMANFTGWAQSFMESLRAFWESLFGGGKREELSAEEEQKIAEMIERPRPFSGFANPFQFGISQKSPEYLVRYSFEALQSWAWERGMARQPDQTPLEFADRLSESVPGLANDFQRMAELYAQVCYARGRLPGTCLPLVKEFWHRLTTLGYEVPQVVG